MDLPKFLVTLLLVCLLTYESYVDAASEEQDFLQTCSSHRCSKHGPEIRFPFRILSHPPSCGAPGMQLSCHGDDTILDHHVLGSCRVTEIYYRHRVINIIPLVEPSTQCPLQKLISTNLATDVYKQPQSSEVTTLVRCSRDFTPVSPYIVGPASCFSTNGTQFWYLALAWAYIPDLPLDCVAVSKGIPIPFSYDKNGPNSTTPTKRQIQSSTLVKQHLLGTSIALLMPANSVNMKVNTVDSTHKGVKHSASTMVGMSSQLQHHLQLHL